MDFNHGSDPEHLHLPVHRHSIPFVDSAANVFSLEPGGTQAMPLPSDDTPHYRRDSINSCALSPSLTDPKWDDNRRASFASTNPFRNDMTAAAAAGPFRQSASTAAGPAMQQSTAAWQFDHASNTASPLSFEPYSTSGDDFDVSDFTTNVVDDVSVASPVHRRISAPVPFSEVQSDGSLMDNQSLQSPRSPNSSNQDWMAMAANDQQSKALPRHMRAGYRPTRPVPSRAASDGIRKKNARIDIPADRNLNNIDELIEHAADDDEVKELKAQRRLLRNREAALASRQRKKQHTEDLEFKETGYVKKINELENEIHKLGHERQRIESDFNALHHKYSEACHAISGCELEKEELVMKHTNETGRLRRQIQFLTEQLDNVNLRDQMSSAQENLGSFTSDMNALTVDPHAYAMHVAPDNDATDMSTGFGHYSAAVQNTPTEPVKPVKRGTEQPIASGVLFMILLCGAFVASKANSRHIIPRMPDEVRVASTTVLDTLLRDPAADAFTANAGLQGIMPQPTVGGQMAQQQGSWDRNLQHDARHTLYRSMTLPTGQPTPEQVFALSANEYHSLTSPEAYIGNPAQSTPTPRRNLAETLANLRQESISKASPAEVYSRSLLWDQIPVDVVRQFKELVKESSRTMDVTGEDFALGSQMKHEYDETPLWSPYHMGPTGYETQNA